MSILWSRHSQSTLPSFVPPTSLAMKRRSFMASVIGVLGASALGFPASWAAGPGRVRPGHPGWPSPDDWASLNRAVHNRLEPVTLPALNGKAATELLSNPFYLGDQPGLTQISGWTGAWQSSPSAYVVKAKDASDVAHAVRFAAAHRLRLVVKGGGHSYLGGSNAPDSLLVWTRGMDAIALHDAFVPRGCATEPVQAVSVGAGCIWLHAYQAVTTEAGRYVQGGGCTTVGVAGLVQGGGFGSFSKGYGLAAASLLEAEIVTADGVVRVVNACREPELFWALKGGGGGTFGIVTRMTLRTHALPQYFGGVRWEVKASSDTAFRTLLTRFLDHYAANLLNPHWGEQVRATRDNRLVVGMVFQGIDEDGARGAFRGLVDFVAAHGEDYQVLQPFIAFSIPAQHCWDVAFLREHAPSAISIDRRPGAGSADYWWAGDGEQAGALCHGYNSTWLPAALLQGEGQAVLAEAWFAASRHWSVAFHFNKGLAGASTDTLAASRDTAMNPEVLDAFALAIIAGDGPSSFAGLPEPDQAAARDDAKRIQAAGQALRRAAPDAGNYLSECDYFYADWQRASWGTHWARLSAIKKRYDPDGLFTVHHGVGSEAWSEDGFTRVGSLK
jgi:FAD/FMN-containing dehydrogenase